MRRSRLSARRLSTPRRARQVAGSLTAPDGLDDLPMVSTISTNRVSTGPLRSRPTVGPPAGLRASVWAGGPGDQGQREMARTSVAAEGADRRDRRGTPRRNDRRAERAGRERDGADAKRQRVPEPHTVELRRQKIPGADRQRQAQHETERRPAGRRPAAPCRGHSRGRHRAPCGCRSRSSAARPSRP